MKPSAVVLSVARGGCIDTGALVGALRRGEIGGAGLDVTDPEPLPPGHPVRPVAQRAAHRPPWLAAVFAARPR
eukprot:SAG11_NODE_8570_length_1000_cov_0.871254_1_plen_72_part_01